MQGGWHDRVKFENIGIKAKQMDGTDLQPRSTWTWVTGDQHLSNFGAWRNRGGEVVFSVNDFDVSCPLTIPIHDSWPLFRPLFRV